MLAHTDLETSARKKLITRISISCDFVSGIEFTANPDPAVQIYTCSIKQEAKPIIEEIFIHLIQFPETPLTLGFLHPAPLNSSQGMDNLLIDHNILRNPDSLCLIPDFLLNSTLISALHSAYTKLHLAFHLNPFTSALLRDLVNVPDANYSDSTICLYAIFREDKRKYAARDIKKLAALIIFSRSLVLLILKYGFKELSDFLLDAVKEQPELLHQTFAKSGLPSNEVDSLLKCLGQQAPILFDFNGNSLMHLCRHPKFFPFAMKHLPDVNHTNMRGNSCLDTAITDGDTEKVWLLLRNGALWKSSSDNNHFDMIPIDNPKATLTHFKLFKSNGVGLSSPPESMVQRGAYCGINAAAAIIQFFQRTSPKLRAKPYCPARKSDVTPKAPLSIRQIAKQVLKITQIGEILQASHLAAILNYFGCQHAVCTITVEAQFRIAIKTALQLDLPVLLPFAANHGKPVISNDGAHIHWAFVIAYSHTEIEALMVAQYGKYYTDTVSRFFHSNMQLPDQSPEVSYLKKQGEYEDLSEADLAAARSTKKRIITIPQSSLDDFRSKLVIAMPPEFDKGVWEDALIRNGYYEDCPDQRTTGQLTFW